MQERNFLIIQGFMRTKLNLKGNELLAYALIYGFSQDGESVFSGSSKYVADWLGIDRRNALDVLKRLTEKGLIIKQEKTVNGVKLADYRIDENIIPYDETSQGGYDETSHHNIGKDNIIKTDTNVSVEKPAQDIKDKIFPKEEAERAIGLWNSIPTLPNVIKLSDKRKAALKNLLKEYDWEQFGMVIDNIKASSFLNGTGKWACSFDWILNKNNFLKVLEGQYNDREQTQQKAVGKVAHKANEYGDDFDENGNFKWEKYGV